MRKITHSGSQYLRYSVFNPDKTERRPAIERLRASHRALRGDVDLVSLPENSIKRHSLQLACIDHGFSFPPLFRVIRP